MSPFRSLRTRWLAVLAVTATLFSVPVVPAAAEAQATPADGPAARPGPCAAIAPLASVHAGDVGTGWTVVRGSVPRPFKVRVLGVYPDGVAAGRDLIMARVSDVPGRHFIEAAGGIWAGMSGSPVYVGGRLIGAVAYGFSTGPSMIGGLTPAEDMAGLLSLSGAGARTARAGDVRLSADVRRDLVERTGVTPADIGSFGRLPMPVAVSGLSARGRRQLQDRLERAGVEAIITPGATVARPADAASGTPVPGGNFAALLSYGDVSFGGVGTTTWVCGARALAFGHPLTFEGAVSFGANDARSLAIVTDPTTGPFKMAVITALFGTLDQDRRAGIRAHLGEAPTVIPVIARVSALDLGTSRTGRTDVTASSWVPYIAPEHVYQDVTTAVDRAAAGSGELHLVIEGRRSDGTPFRVERGDRVASTYDIAWDSAYMLDEVLAPIGGNVFDDITFTRVTYTATIAPTYEATTIRRVLVSKNGGSFRERTEMRVAPGDQLAVRTVLRDYRGDARSVLTSLTVPADATGYGGLSVSGGNDCADPCSFDPASCDVGSFPALLASLRNAPRNDELLVDLAFQDDGGETVARGSVAQQLDRVVSGGVMIGLLVQ